MRGIVPDPVLARRDKIGFLTTERDWLVAAAPGITGILEGQVASGIAALSVREMVNDWALIITQGRRTSDSRVWRWGELHPLARTDRRPSRLSGDSRAQSWRSLMRQRRPPTATAPT